MSVDALAPFADVDLDANPLSGFTVGVADAGDHLLVETVEGLGGRVLLGPASSGRSRSASSRDVLPTHALLEAAAAGALDALAVGSPAAVRSLLTVAAELQLLDSLVVAAADGLVIVCVGSGCAAIARDRGFDSVVTVEPEATAVARALTDAFAARVTTLDLAGHRVRCQGCLVRIDDLPVVAMTVRERQVFDHLSRRPGVVVSKRELLRAIWPGSDAEHHTVEVTVSRLRRRLGDAGDCIETVIRRGYRLAAS